ncbi:hypothetical protein QTH87_13475 [Variovorax sp. J22P168]|nr:hypothetical protein [Variovorax sp. J22P168]
MTALAYLTRDLSPSSSQKAGNPASKPGGPDIAVRDGAFEVRDRRTGRVERISMSRPDIARHIAAHGAPGPAARQRTGLTMSAINVIGDAIGEALRQREAPDWLTLTAADVEVIATALKQRDARIVALESRMGRKPTGRIAGVLGRAAASLAAADRVLLG